MLLKKGIRHWALGMSGLPTAGKIRYDNPNQYEEGIGFQ